MNEDRFDELMRDAERTYRTPPTPDFDAMWKSIEREHFGAPARPQVNAPTGLTFPAARPGRRW